jgi:hypothetical protein
MELRFLPDNRILASNGNLFYLWQWMTEPTPRIVHDVPDVPGVFENPRRVIILASSPDGQLIAATLQGRIVIVADCKGNLLYKICRGNEINCMAISPDKECLAIADSDGIHLLDLKTEKLRWSLKKGGGPHWDRIAFSPDRHLLALMDDEAITLCDLHTRRMPQVLRTGEPIHRTRELAFSADSSTLRTNRGMWPLPDASNSLSAIPASLVTVGEWVIWEMARVLWIPQHLVSKTVVAGNRVALVPKPGLPIWVEFDPSKRPNDEALVNRFTWEDATDCRFDEVAGPPELDGSAHQMRNEEF